MKIPIVFFIVFLTLYTVVNSAPNVDFKSNAVVLLKKVNDLIHHASQVMIVQKDVRQKLDALKGTLDFGIPQSPILTQVQDLLKQHQGQKGIEACTKLNVDRTADLRKELDTTLAIKVSTQIMSDKLNLLSINEDLANITQSLEGPQLDGEIKLCTDTPAKCRITNDFPKLINESEKFINDTDEATPKLIEASLKTILAEVPKRITNEVLKVVTDCINKL